MNADHSETPGTALVSRCPETGMMTGLSDYRDMDGDPLLEPEGTRVVMRLTVNTGEVPVIRL